MQRGPPKNKNSDAFNITVRYFPLLYGEKSKHSYTE